MFHNDQTSSAWPVDESIVPSFSITSDDVFPEHDRSSPTLIRLQDHPNCLGISRYSSEMSLAHQDHASNDQAICYLVQRDQPWDIYDNVDVSQPWQFDWTEDIALTETTQESGTPSCQIPQAESDEYALGNTYQSLGVLQQSVMPDVVTKLSWPLLSYTVFDSVFDHGTVAYGHLQSNWHLDAGVLYTVRNIPKMSQDFCNIEEFTPSSCDAGVSIARAPLQVQPQVSDLRDLAKKIIPDIATPICAGAFTSDSAISRGRRKGSLKPSTRKSTYLSRLRKSCLHCKLRKRTCSDGFLCEECLRYPRTNSFYIDCRTPLHNQIWVLLPDEIYQRFQPDAVASSIKRRVAHTLGQPFTIDISLDDYDQGVTMEVFEIKPTDTLLQASRKFVTIGDRFGLRMAQAPTLALSFPAVSEIEMKLQQYLDLTVQRPRSYLEVEGHRMTRLEWRVHTAIVELANASPDLPLLRKSLKLQAMICLLTIGICLPEGSSLLTRLNRSLQHEYAASDCLTIINMQIKQTLSKMIQTTLAEILATLDNYFSTRGNNKRYTQRDREALWASIFSTVFLLQVSTEMQQALVDLRIVKSMAQGFSDTLRDESRRTALLLENWLSRWIIEPYHYLFRTNATKSCMTSFNPLSRLGAKVLPWPDVRHFIAELRCIVADHNLELQAEPSRPLLYLSGNRIQDHVRYRQENCGHLTQAFLRHLTSR